MRWFTWEGWIIPRSPDHDTSEIVSKAKMSFKRKNESMERRQWEDASGSQKALEVTQQIPDKTKQHEKSAVKICKGKELQGTFIPCKTVLITAEK